jgi:hypothetical protein
MQLDVDHHVTTADDVLGDFVAGDIERAPFAGLAATGLAVLGVDGTNAR